MRGRQVKKQACGLALIIALAGVSAARAHAQDWPLSQDDIKILLIGGAKPDKMIEMIRHRGVDFQMNPDLAKKFHDLGATDEVIDALQRAAAKGPSPAGANASPAAPPAPPANSQGSPTAAKPASKSPPAQSVQDKINQAMTEKTPVVDEDAPAAGNKSSGGAAANGSPSAPAKAVDLSDPSPDEIQHIIQEFAAKEKMFKLARDNYAYHQINKVDEMGPNNEVVGTYRQDWDILFDNAGKRVEEVTYAPLPTLKSLIVTQEDLNSFRSIQPFVLTTDDLPEYDIKYLGHVKVDYITTYVFKVRPKEIKKGKQYFDGIVWVDDRDLQIVKSEGKPVPELKNKNGGNLFPRFTTYREQIDGKFWFPTYTMADDTLYFPGNPVRIKEVIRYTNYKQFKASSTIKVVGSLDDDKSKSPEKPNPPKQK
ncbi:MAG: hypothetical protein ACM3NO_01660 [Deltaproteobacteria bacterium]